MTEPKHYDCRMAAANLMLTPGEITKDIIKVQLGLMTDIPADRIDFAAGELMAAVPHLRMTASLFTFANGRMPNADEVMDMVPSFDWIDDDKGEATMTCSVREADGTEAFKVTAKTKIKGE